MLPHQLTFSPELNESFFQELPPAPAVFLLRGDGEPYVSKTANLRRRLQRLLGVPAENSKRLNLRDRVREIEYTLTGSDFESQFLLYRLLRETFPEAYAARLRLRPAPLIKLHLENEYPRASVTTRLARATWGNPPSVVQSTEARLLSDDGKSGLRSEQGRARPSADIQSRTNLYYGPFPSRVAAERFASDVLDFFKMRRCVEDLHPDPAFPGCVYSEMKMCLAPCFKGCTDQEYHAEVARVQAFLDTFGDSLARELASQRDRASADLAFEEAATIHSKIEKLKPLLAQLPEIVRRIDGLDAIIVQPSAEAQSVSLFRFAQGTLAGPVIFNIEAKEQSRSMEWQIEEIVASFPLIQSKSAIERTEHLAMLKRWYYRSTRVGEIFFADENGSWPLRRIVRGIGRVFKGEKSPEQATKTFSATPAALPPS